MSSAGREECPNSALDAQGVNPASEEAQELRETGAKPVLESQKIEKTEETKQVEAEKKPEFNGEEQEKTHKKRPVAEFKPAAEDSQPAPKKAKEEEKSDNAPEGMVDLAVECASNAAAQAKAAAVAKAAEVATATKETVRKYGAAAVIDAELLYDKSKERAAQFVEGSKAAVQGVAQKASLASGNALRQAGDKLAAAGKPADDPKKDGTEEEP